MTFLQTLFPPKIDPSTPVEYWVVTLREYEGVHYGNQTLREQTTWDQVSKGLLWKFDVPANIYSVSQPIVVLTFDSYGRKTTSLRTKNFLLSIPGDLPVRSVEGENEFLEDFRAVLRLRRAQANFLHDYLQTEEGKLLKDELDQLEKGYLG
jgi:hypothetical protein